MDSTDASKCGYGTTSAPEILGTQLSISLLSGKTAFGPAAVDFSNKRVGDICEDIAKEIEVHPEAVVLLLGEKELNSKKTLQEEGVKTGMEIQAMVLSAVEVATRILADKFSPDIDRLHSDDQDCDGRALVDEVPALSEAESLAWITSLASQCGCIEHGFPAEIDGWLKAICACKKVSGFGREFNRETVAEGNEGSCPGLLALNIADQTEDWNKMYLVDLNGDLASLFGADPTSGKGAVWFSCLDCGRTDNLPDSLTFTPGHFHSLQFTRKLVEELRTDLLPYVVAPCLTEFFVRWDSSECKPSKKTDDVPGVQQFFDDAVRKKAEQEEQKFVVQLQGIVAFLSKGDSKPLSEADLRPIAEILGLIPTPVSNEEDFVPNVCASLDKDVIAAAWHDQFKKLCAKYESTSQVGLPTDALIDYMLNTPPLVRLFDDSSFAEYDEEIAFQVLSSLREGPMSNGCYLSVANGDVRAALAEKVLTKQVFTALDKDCDGFLSCEELRPFCEMMWASTGDPEDFDHQDVLTPLRPGDMAPTASKSQFLERWEGQYAKMCSCWEAGGASSFSEIAFAKFVQKLPSNDATELLWALQCLEGGPPPGNHYMNIMEYAFINITGLEDALNYQYTNPLPGSFVEEAYALACQWVTRKLQWVEPNGDVYHIIVNSTRRGMPDRGRKFVAGLW